MAASSDPSRLDKLNKLFKGFSRWGDKLRSPTAFFGTLGLSIAIGLGFTLPHILLFTLGGLAAASIGCYAVGAAGTGYVDRERGGDTPPAQFTPASNSTANGATVTFLPGLSESFARGRGKSATGGAFQLKNGKSAFLSK